MKKKFLIKKRKKIEHLASKKIVGRRREMLPKMSREERS